MDLFGSNVSSDVGLRLLLTPLCSTVVFRTACCTVGIAFPVYSTFKAIEQKDQNEQQRWLVYWAGYYHVKFAFLVWLQLPSTDGSRYLYMRHLRPFLLRHQAKLDQIVGFFYGEMAKFMSLHQAQIRLARICCSKVWTGVRHIINSEVKQVSGAIEGPTTQELHDSTNENSTTERQIQDSESNHEE